jgi:hypothetical protein
MISARATQLPAAGNNFPEGKPDLRLLFPLPFGRYGTTCEVRTRSTRRLKKTEDAMKSATKWTESISVFAVGVGVGAALGVLFAPRSGNDTRDLIAETAQEQLDGAIAAGHKITQRAQEGIDQIKGQVRQAADVGERAYREAKNTSA